MRRATIPLVVLLAGLLAACDGWPGNTPRTPAQPPDGAVPRGASLRAAALAPPGPQVDDALLAFGAARYAIWCAPCHGARGAGDGAVVARGFPRPPALPADPARSMAAIARNVGGAHPFDDRILPRERWAIARQVERMAGAP